MSNENECPNKNYLDDTNTLESDHAGVFEKNPMMNRVTAALHQQLQKSYDRIHQQLLKEQNDLRNAKKDREDCGVQLYGMQQQLARLQGILDSANKDHIDFTEKREHDESKATKTNHALDDKQKKLVGIGKEVNEKRNNLEDLLSTVKQAKKVNQEMESEVAVSRGIAEKAGRTVDDLQKGKVTQDIFINNLIEQIKRSRYDNDILEERLKRQCIQTNDVHEMLNESTRELEILTYEKTQLVQRWNSSIIALGRRDQALAVSIKAMKEAEDSVLDKISELKGLNREKNTALKTKDSLTLDRNRLESEKEFINEEISNLSNQEEMISKQFELLQKSNDRAHEERALEEINIGKVTSELTSISHKMEIIAREKYKLEEQIGLNKYNQATLSQANQKSIQRGKELLKTIYDKDLEAASLSNELARVKIDSLNTTAHISQLDKRLKAETDAIKAKDLLISNYQADIKRKHGEIDSKTSKLDRLNKKYEMMLDGVEEPEHLGPLEATIRHLEKNIQSLSMDTKSLQDDWVKSQTNLLKQINDAEILEEENSQASAMIHILKRKKMRLLNDTNLNEATVKSIETNINGMHNDMSRLNDLICRHSELQVSLTNSNDVKEIEFSQEVKGLDLSSCMIGSKIEDMQIAKEKALTELFEVERMILDWEKKINLEKETRAVLHSSDDAYEIKGMETEIHRMTHRLENLKREQERITRQMELAIHKREDIAVKHGARAPRDGRFVTVTDVKRKQIDLNRKMYLTKQEIVDIIAERDKIKKKLQDIDNEIIPLEQEVKNIFQQNELYHTGANDALFEKQRILAKLDRIQEMAKMLDNDINPFSDKKEYIQKQFDIEKKTALAKSRLKRIQNVIAGIRIKKQDYDSALDRMKILIDDIITIEKS